MTEKQTGSTPAFPAAATFNTMSDLQLRQTISQLSSYAAPTPAKCRSSTYLKNIHTWSTSSPSTSTSTPRNSGSGGGGGGGGGGRSGRTRASRSSHLANASTSQTQTQYIQPIYQPPIPAVPVAPNPPKPALPTVPLAIHSTYASRLRTGATLLMQPILGTMSVTHARSGGGRRGAVINYADPGSGDDIPDAGALESDDSDFIASGGTRMSIRQGRSRAAATSSSSFLSSSVVADQSYLGMVPPSRFIKERRMPPTAHVYPSQDMVEQHASKRSSLIPIRVEFETDTHRVRDCFVWNVHEKLIRPETFARTFCNDLDLPQAWVETISNQIRAQIEEQESVASMDLGLDGALDMDTAPPQGEELAECRVILSIDVQIANHHLMDHVEWDLLSPLTPEDFSKRLCMEIGLGGEAIPLVAHAVHEELMKHKKDAIEWGVIGGEREVAEEGKERGGVGMLKDKTGLGYAWGRTPKEGRGPKKLKSIWRDWAEAEEFKTKFEVLTAEEVERRELEKERASRRLRRETSKFQTTRTSRRIRY